MTGSNIKITEEEQSRCILSLTDHILELREAAGLSQGDMAIIAGITRQTYSAIELKKRDMSWSTYTSLMFVFLALDRTRKMLRQYDVLPEQMMTELNGGLVPDTIFDSFQDERVQKMFNSLDEQAKHAIKTTILVEYARCNKISGDAVLKAFDGVDFMSQFTENDKSTAKAIRGLKKRGNSAQ